MCIVANGRRKGPINLASVCSKLSSQGQGQGLTYLHSELTRKTVR